MCRKDTDSIAQCILWLQGRNVFVKYADSHKGKTGQPVIGQLAALPVAPGYVQMQHATTHISSPQVGYNYPQAIGSYPAPYPGSATAPYPTVSGMSTSPVGMNNYPYYYPKQ